MKREALKELGLTDEQIDKVMSENGKDIESTKSKFADYEAVKTQLVEANTQIESFKTLDVDGIKKAADEWKTKAETAEKSRIADIEKLQFDYALDGALSGAKAKNAKAVKALIDVNGLKFNNGEVIGLKEQLEKIKSENDYLFEGEAAPPAIFSATPNQSQQPTGIDAIRSAMGLKTETKG